MATAQRPFTILVAGTDKKTLESVEIPLKVRGLAAERFEAEGEPLLAEITRRAPDILFLNLPADAAAQTTVAVRHQFPSMAVVAMHDGTAEAGLLLAGACAALKKPVDLEPLLLALGRALGARAVGASDVRESPVSSEMKKVHRDTARVLVNLMEVNDPALGGHSKRVAFWCHAIGQKMGLLRDELFELETAGLLHDIGKLALPERLQKTPMTELKEFEIEIIHQHPIHAQTMLEVTAEFRGTAALIRSHLEHMDGSGYPDHMKGEQIPLGARILGAANAYDELKQRRLFTLEAFASERSKEEYALGQLHKQEGRYYDTAVIHALESVALAVASKVRVETVTVERLKPGMMLSHDILTKDGTLLVTHGLMLNTAQIDRIRAFYQMGMLGREIIIEHHVKHW